MVDTFLIPPLVVDHLMTYPLACDDVVQLTLILVAFSMNALTPSGGPLGAINKVHR